jgi:hypothetical protein
MTNIGSYSDAANEHMAQAEAFMGPAEGDYMQGDITAGKGGDAALQSGGFTGAEVEAHVNDGNITAPDDSVQVETGLMPFLAPPAAAAMKGTDDTD